MLINRFLHTDEVQYASKMSKAILIEKVKEVLEKGTDSLRGKFTNENEFRIADSQVVIGWDIPGLERKAAYLKGRITDGEKGSYVNLKTNPNLAYHYFALVAIFAGLIVFILSFCIQENSMLYLIVGVVFIICGLTYLAVGVTFRNRLRNKFVKHFNLFKV